MTIRFLRALSLAAICATSSSLQAGSATWKSNAQDDSWFNSANWNPATIPDGPADVASFGVTNVSFITGLGATLSQIDFAANASTYQITLDSASHTIGGAGITGSGEKFVIPVGIVGDVLPELVFANAADAGSNQFVLNGSNNISMLPGDVIFRDNSAAGSAVFSLPSGGQRGRVVFLDSSSASLASFFSSGLIYIQGSATAAQGYFEIEGGSAPGVIGGYLWLGEASHGGSAQFVVQAGVISGAPGGIMVITGSAVAEAAQIFANDGPGDGGLIQFLDSSTIAGGMASFQLNGKGQMDISGARENPAIGSLSGTGPVFLGTRKLTSGRNLMSTTYSGLLQDGGISGGTGGSFAKVGSGTLTLMGANTYTGSTSLNGGTLKLINTTGSVTGTGPVQANAGNLGGSAIIAGAVTIGANNADRPHLAPATGSQVPGSLTMESGLIFNSNGGYNYLLRAKGRRILADRVNANGVIINSGATFTLLATVKGAVQIGTTATVINNTSANPISGTFANLADGAVLTVGSNKFQANYKDGDGNDLTLTVVP